MFTGIVEETGTISSISATGDSRLLVVQCHECGRGVRVGDSVAVNGCCLTVVRRRAAQGGVALSFNLLNETWERTNLSEAATGDRVNLERAVAAGARFDGHFVTGHVDGTGKISRWEQEGRDHVLEIATPADLRRYLVPKGSITVDGISLTIARELKRGFQVWIIPHTRKVTALAEKKVGDRVNLEADLIGKYVARFMDKAARR